MTTWHDKAHRIIGELCAASERQANTRKDGTRTRKHHQYSVPAIAQELVEALGQKNEERAKAIFMQLHDTPELGRE